MTTTRTRASEALLNTVTITRGKVETAAFTRALLELAATGQRPHCSDASTGELWLSDHEAERREAVQLCRGCPVLEPCGTAARGRQERWGVWAGVDHTRTPSSQSA